MEFIIRNILLNESVKLLKKRLKKSLIKIDKLIDFYDVERGEILRKIRNNNRLDFVYIILHREDVERKDKKVYLYNTSLSTNMKDNIWQKYIGDYWFLYCSQKNYGLEVVI